MDNSLRLHHDDSELLTDVLSYRRLVRRLLYLTTTRPDIAFATQQLSQFMSKPTRSHLATVMRVLKYLKGRPGQGFFFPRDSQIQLTSFRDADWGTCIDSRRSITGYFSLLEVLSSRGRQRSRTQFPDLLLKQNIELLPRPLVSYNGLLTCSKI